MIARFLPDRLPAPRADADRVYANAEQVCGNEPVLRRLHPDHTDQHAVCGRNREPGPEFSADKDGGENGKEAGEIVQMKHGA